MALADLINEKNSFICEVNGIIFKLSLNLYHKIIQYK